MTKAYNKPRFFGTIGFILCVALTLAGCVGVAPSGPDGREHSGKAIVITDETRVNASLRRDFETAVALLNDEKFPEAIDLLEKVITRSPKSTAPYINLAMAYRKLEKLDEAERSLKKVLEISPSHPAAGNEYGRVLRRQGRFMEARQVYEGLLKKYPEYFPARKNLGILCDIYLGDLSCALEQYEIYSEARPGEEQVKLWMVDLRRRQ